MMGIGGTLIPGGNTGLVLVGMPLLWPYAWLAFASICITIYFAIHITRFAGATALRTRIGSRVRR
ncbi:hypothetical protein D3C72_2235130 [compost metagenome]